MVIHIIIAALLAIFGIVILAGKGDNLIAGYNTASKEEKEKVNIKRLRLVIGILMLLLGLMYYLCMKEESLSSMLAFAPIALVLCFVDIALANSWAKKK